MTIKQEAGLKIENMEITSEESEKFTALTEKALMNYYDFGPSFSVWEEFLAQFEGAYDYNIDEPQKLFQLRELWGQMKKGGEKYEQFFEKEILEQINQPSGYSNTYRMMDVYFSLHATNRARFINTLLSNENVWNASDGSLVHNILNDIELFGGDTETPMILSQYLENICSTRYKRRGDLRDMDISSVVHALVAEIGKEETQNIIKTLSLENDYLAAWSRLSQNDSYVWNKRREIVSVPPFNEKKEEEYTKALKEKLAELKINPPKSRNDFGYGYDEAGDWYDGDEDDDYDDFFEQSDEKEEEEKTQGFHYQQIAEMKSPTEKILKQIAPKIEAGEYRLIIGDESSGRIPALLFSKIINGMYDERGFLHPSVKFLAGSRFLKGAEKEAKKADIARFFDRIKISQIVERGTRALVVTDTIASGASLDPLIETLKENGVELDVVSVGDETYNDMEKKWGENVYYGMRGTPRIYTSRLGGTQKEPTDLFSVSEKKNTFLGVGSEEDRKRNVQERINNARADVSFLANNILAGMKK
jgi:hypothetical protein